MKVLEFKNDFIRATVGISGNVLFDLRDVLRVTIDTCGGDLADFEMETVENVVMVNESGIYTLSSISEDIDFRRWITNTALPSFAKAISDDTSVAVKNIDRQLAEIYDFTMDGKNRMSLLEIYNSLEIYSTPTQKDFNKIKQYLSSMSVSWSVKNGVPFYKMPPMKIRFPQ